MKVCPLDIDQEFQGWILALATLTALYLFCLPAACAGASCESCRVFAAWMRRHLPLFFFTTFIINAVMLRFIIKCMPDWTVSDYIKIGLGAVKTFAPKAMKYITSIAEIVAAVFAFMFRDRIMQLFNIKPQRIFRCRLSDVGHLVCCCPSPSMPIEITFWKAEDLKSAVPFAANNVFAEVHYGYNEVMKTRVHDNAGSGCIFKETIQINFDPTDDDEKLIIFIKNQKMVGMSELGRLELSKDQVLAIKSGVKTLANKPQRNIDQDMRVKYDDDTFPSYELHARGRVWFRIGDIDDDDHSFALKEMATC